MCSGACSPGTSTRFRGKRPISTGSYRLRFPRGQRPDQAGARGAHPLRAREAGRGGPARARARPGREARLQRRPVRAVPGGGRGARARPPGAEPLPGRRRLPARRRPRGETRRRAGERRRRRRGRRGRQLPLHGGARPGGRGGVRLAVVPKLRPRRDEDGRRGGTRAADRPPLRRGAHPRRGHRAHEDRLPLQPEQPDGDDDPARGRGRLPRRRPGTRPHRPRRGLLRVRRGARLPRRDRGALQGWAPRARPAHVLEDLRPGRPARRLRDRPGGRRRRGQEGAERLRRHAAARGRRGGEPGGRRGAHAAAPTERRGALPPHRGLRGPRPGGSQAGRGQLRLRRGRRRRAVGLRRAPARGRHRAPARGLRRSGRDPRYRRHARADRPLRAGVPARGRRDVGRVVPRTWTLEALVEGVRGGDRRALARAITLVESSDPLAYELIRELYPETGRTYVVGVTGPPGVGKSTLIAALVRLVREQGRTVGVISVDPSSPFTKGALLGDRIRLADHFLDPGVFIRSMGTRGHLGGLAEATLQAALVLDAAGKDLLFLETVGAGQSEVEVIGISDTVLLVLMPGSGDSVQALKAGIMEIPDVIAVNKRDHPAAKTMVSEVRSILALDTERDWRPPIVLTEAVSGEGVEELWGEVEAHRAHLEETGTLAERRARNLAGEVFAVASARAKTRLQEAVAEDDELRRLLGEVQRRELDPLTAVRGIMGRG